VDISHNLYTKHGLHFNKFGKIQLAKKLAFIVQLMFGKKIDPPMALGWPTPLLDSGDLLTVVNPADIVEDQNESEHVYVSIGMVQPIGQLKGRQQQQQVHQYNKIKVITTVTKLEKYVK
jgi:hypothetical protein